MKASSPSVFLQFQTLSKTLVLLPLSFFLSTPSLIVPPRGAIFELSLLLKQAERVVLSQQTLGLEQLQ